MGFKFKEYAGQGQQDLANKFTAIRKHLQAMNSKANAHKVGGGETITDDGSIPADRKGQVARDEALVRAALQLVGVDYNALISMDNGSVYAKAVAANPQLLQDVNAAQEPVLAALQIAVGFKPVADFTGKYGTTPDEIKAKMRAEFEAEQAAAASAQPKDKPSKAAHAAPVFSTYAGGRAEAPRVAGGDLKAVFGK